MSWLFRTLEKFAFPAMNAAIPALSPAEIQQTCNMEIGPIYHGTSYQKLENIREHGFKWEHGESGTSGTEHGYAKSDYWAGCYAPVHHLGYGIYFTQVKSIAKMFGYDSAKNVMECYIDKSARIEVINFAAPKTMMNWWIKNGYDCDLAKTDRIAATKQMTDVIAARCDAVLFKGKTIYKALDGNQICIYNPSILRREDKTLAQSGDIGSKVRRKSDGMLGTILYRRPIDPIHQHYHNNESELLRVKWRKGGTDFNVQPGQVEFL